MSTNRNAVRILCYGDSNTWGADPHDDAPRYPVTVRWAGKLQDQLGSNYEIIEEGLCGRTTVLDDPKEEGRNGKTYLIPCLQTHNPIDIVILMLGTNDLKERFNLSAENIADNVGVLIKIVRELGENKEGKPPRVILISPPLINEHIDTVMEGIAGAEEKSKQFGMYYQKVAQKNQCDFLDISKCVRPSTIDGCHLDPEAHTIIAKKLAEKIKG